MRKRLNRPLSLDPGHCARRTSSDLLRAPSPCLQRCTTLLHHLRGWILPPGASCSRRRAGGRGRGRGPGLILEAGSVADLRSSRSRRDEVETWIESAPWAGQGSETRRCWRSEGRLRSRAKAVVAQVRLSRGSI